MRTEIRIRRGPDGKFAEFQEQPYPGNPTGTNFQYTVDPTMLALIKQIPASLANNTRVGDGVNLLGYQLNARANNTQDNYGFRVDYDLNQHNTITGTWAWNRQIVDRPDYRHTRTTRFRW